MGAHVQTGIIAAVSVEEYDSGIIKKHEYTRPEKEDDRTMHIQVTKANTGPVFLTFRNDGSFNNQISGVINRDRDITFEADDGTLHSIWRIRDSNTINEISTYFKRVRSLYIADGHHRAASASRVHREMTKNKHVENVKESYNYFLATIFPHDEMQIMGYNRVVKDLCGLSDEQFISKLRENFDIQIVNSTLSDKRKKYVNYLFKKLQRTEGLLERDCDKMVRNDRVIWGSCMVACGDADAMVTGNSRRYGQSLEKVKKVIDARPGEIMFGLNMIVNKGKTVFIADTSVHEYPTSEQLSEIAISASRVAKLFGFEPKVAFLSHSTFGQPITARTKHIRDAVEILKNKKVNFKFDGDMQPDVALSDEYKDLYPFSEIVGNANILIMPGQHSAAITYKIMKTLGGAKVIGPLLIGLGQAIEIAPLRSSTSDILNLASVAAYSAGVINYKKPN